MFKSNKIKQLFEAVKANNVERAKKILEKKVDLNAREKIFGNTLLHEAASLEMIQLLLEGGANPNILNSSKKSPVEYAKSKEIVSILIKAGAVCAKEYDEVERSLLYNVFSYR